jgi:hypothetical protein
LEKEKEDLQELLHSLKHENSGWNTPGRFSNAGGISPIHRQVLNMTLKTPKTPGAPLRDVSILLAIGLSGPLTPRVSRCHGCACHPRTLLSDRTLRKSNAWKGSSGGRTRV